MYRGSILYFEFILTSDIQVCTLLGTYPQTKAFLKRMFFSQGGICSFPLGCLPAPLWYLLYGIPSFHSLGVGDIQICIVYYVFLFLYTCRVSISVLFIKHVSILNHHELSPSTRHFAKTGTLPHPLKIYSKPKQPSWKTHVKKRPDSSWKLVNFDQLLVQLEDDVGVDASYFGGYDQFLFGHGVL